VETGAEVEAGVEVEAEMEAAVEAAADSMVEVAVYLEGACCFTPFFCTVYRS
jgi:hypothetical protein